MSSGDIDDQLKKLYPYVDENQTPLPKAWNHKDKSPDIGLTPNGLRATYKGSKRSQTDAASVRATHPIPPSCGIYYFEVKIVSKGVDGYMGIGLSQQGVNINRLPGWDKNSFGYHGDDGHSFNASPTGQPYGPTFTTGDVIGCCVNFVTKSCFYTKNGVKLGTAFENLPPNLYPTVGLKTQDEAVEANFGELPFLFDIHEYIQTAGREARQEVMDFPVKNERGQFHITMERLVLSYLVHQGYSASAEALSRVVAAEIDEPPDSIRNRQKIQGLVLAGRIGQAIEETQQLYPGLLEHSPDLLFMLKVRQFIEMVNGTETELRGGSLHHVQHTRAPSCPVARSSPQHTLSPSHHRGGSGGGRVRHSPPFSSHTPCRDRDSSSASEDEPLSVSNGVGGSGNVSNGFSNGNTSPEEDMDCDHVPVSVCPEEVEVREEGARSPTDSPPHKRPFCADSPAGLETLIQFGRELHSLSVQLRHERGKNPTSKKILEDAFSLLAYSDPWHSPLGQQLHPDRREAVATALNSAILASRGESRVPLMQQCLAHTEKVLGLMADKGGLGWRAFVSPPVWLRDDAPASPPPVMD